MTTPFYSNFKVHNLDILFSFNVDIHIYSYEKCPEWKQFSPYPLLGLLQLQSSFIWNSPLISFPASISIYLCSIFYIAIPQYLEMKVWPYYSAQNYTVPFMHFGIKVFFRSQTCIFLINFLYTNGMLLLFIVLKLFSSVNIFLLIFQSKYLYVN